MLEECSFESGKPETWPKITRNTTVEEAKFIHKKIWDYVVKTGHKPVTIYFADCVACQYAETHYDEKSLVRAACNRCPIKWPDTKYCHGPGGLFDKWVRDHSLENAMAIRDVEWKGDKDD